MKRRAFIRHTSLASVSDTSFGGFLERDVVAATQNNTHSDEDPVKVAVVQQNGNQCGGGSNITGPKGKLITEIWDKEGIDVSDVYPDRSARYEMQILGIREFVLNSIIINEITRL